MAHWIFVFNRESVGNFAINLNFIRRERNMQKANKTKHYGKLFTILLLISGIFFAKSTANAEENKNWLDTYEEMRNEMEQEAKDIVQKEISKKEKKDVAEEDLGTLLASCDIENAIPLWQMPYDFRMIADYKKNDGDFSKFITWNNEWYIPAQTMSGTYASIYTQKEGTKYEVYGIYLGDDSIYAADDMESIKSIVKQNFGDDAADVRIINLPFYEMNLIYVKNIENNEFIMPYEARLTNVIETIGGETGKVYELSDFIQEMDDHFEEYTEQELRTIASQESAGGKPELKLKTSPEKENNFIFSIVIAGILLIICIFAVIYTTKRMRRDTK